jgi:predicted TPR repeat methyltransferase
VIEYARKACDDAILLNTVTQRIDQQYDLVIATNVLVYMPAEELLLAMNNIALMLKPGGYFVHNDTRFETKLFGRAAKLPAVQFGTVTLDPSRRPPTIDHYVIHRR